MYEQGSLVFPDFVRVIDAKSDPSLKVRYNVRRLKKKDIGLKCFHAA